MGSGASRAGDVKEIRPLRAVSRGRISCRTRISCRSHGREDYFLSFAFSVSPETQMRHSLLMCQVCREPGSMSAMSEFPRDLSDTERAVLSLLLSVEFPGVDAYRQQLAGAVVSSRCPCGCLEFSVEVAPESPIAQGSALSVSAWSEEEQVHIGLEAHGGRLTGVNLMWFGDEKFRLQPNLSTYEVKDDAAA